MNKRHNELHKQRRTNEKQQQHALRNNSITKNCATKYTYSVCHGVLSQIKQDDTQQRQLLAGVDIKLPIRPSYVMIANCSMRNNIEQVVHTTLTQSPESLIWRQHMVYSL